MEVTRLISTWATPVQVWPEAFGVAYTFASPSLTPKRVPSLYSQGFYLDALEPKGRFNLGDIPDMAGYLFEVEQKRYPLTPVWVTLFGKKNKVNCYVFDKQGRLVAPRKLGEDPCKREEEYMKAIDDGDENQLWEITSSK